MNTSYQIVGVLNTTPDSYFDGGKYSKHRDAVLRAGQMLQEGVDIIEIGGESSGPGSKDVSLEEEIQRTIPIIEAIKKEYPEAVLSIDTYKAKVAEQAIEAGVSMVNDVTSGRGDSDLFSVLGKADATLVLMYSKDSTARTTKQETQYDNVIATISSFLAEKKEAAIAAGVSAERIILDPGLGHFVSSDPKYSFEILRRLDEFLQLGCPLFVSPSRKSFLAGPENLPPQERLAGTIAASVLALQNGATFIRTHDVLPVRRALEIASAIRRT